MPFKVYAPDPKTTWNLGCDECGRVPPKQVTSFRVVRTEFQLCDGCFAKFREVVSR